MLGLANMWDNRIIHSRPYSFMASDTFFHASLVDYFAEEGVIKYTPSYEVGGFEGVYDQHPPLLYQLSAMFSGLTGIPSYDALSLINIILMILGLVMLYLIIGQFSTTVAMFSLPATLLILTKGFSSMLFFGQWLFVASIPFMIGVVWCLTKTDMKHIYAMLTLILAGAIISHIPEAIFIGLFAGLFIILKNFKNLPALRSHLSKLAASAFMANLITFPYVIIFLKSFFIGEGYRADFTGSYGFPAVTLSMLGISGIIMLIGAITFFALSKKKCLAAPLFGMFMFLISYTTYLGVGKRAFAHKWLWPLYLSFFFGFIIYLVLKQAIKKWNKMHALGISIIILAIFAQPLYGASSAKAGIMDENNWAALKWISQNTAEGSEVYVFYNDMATQSAALYHAERLMFKVFMDDFISGIKSSSIPDKFRFQLADSYSTYVCDRKGMFSYGYYRDEMKLDSKDYECEPGYEKLNYNGKVQKSICDLEYVYLTKAASQQVFTQYNMAIRNVLLANDWVKEVYSNPLVSILKNNKVGVDCFGQEQAEG